MLFEFLILQCFNLAILLITIFILLRKPAREFLQNRKEKMRLLMDKVSHDLNEAQSKYDEAKRKKSNAAQDAEELKRSLIDTGNFCKDSLIKEADETATRIQRESKLMAAHELQSTQKSIMRDTLNIAFAKAEGMLKKGITKENHEKLISKSLDTLKGMHIS